MSKRVKVSQSIPLSISRGAGTSEFSDVVIPIAISGEAPYPRSNMYGYAHCIEILGHSPEHIDLSRMANGTAPLLLDHNLTGMQPAVMKNVRLDADKVLRGDAVFSNREDALAIADDMQRGIRPQISVGAWATEWHEIGQTDDGTPIVFVTRWCPYETSSVSVGCDNTYAGVGRSIENQNEASDTMEEDETKPVAEEATKAVNLSAMTPEDLQALQEQVAALLSEQTAKAAEVEAPVAEPEVPAPVEEKAERAVVIPKAVKANTKPVETQKMLNAEQINALTALASKYGKLDSLGAWVSTNRSIESVSAEILASLDNTATVINAPAVHIKKGQETMADALKAGLQRNNSELLERGVDQASNAGKRIVPGRIYLPTDVPMMDADKVRAKFAQKYESTQRGGLAFATSANGTGKTFLSFEESLREGALLARLGGKIQTFNDAASLPYWGTGVTAVTIHETGSLTPQTPAVSLRTLIPKRIGAQTTVSNLMGRLNGTYDLMAEVYTEVLADTERMLESQSFGGAGTGNDLLGLSLDSNIAVYAPTPVSGTLGTSAASAMVSVVAKANGDYENGKWVVAHDVYSYMESTALFGNGSGRSVLESVDSRNQVLRTGYLAAPNAGQLTAMFGDFSKVTLGLFGGLEIRIDDTTNAGSAQTLITSELFADIVARQPASLVRWNKILIA